MKILFDYQAISGQDYGGNSRLYIELIKRLKSKCEIDYSLLFSNNHYLRENNFLNALPFFSNQEFKYKNEIKNTINKIYSSKKILFDDYDIFHPTYYNNYYLSFYKKKKPLVLTVLDFIHENYYRKSGISLNDNTINNKNNLIKKASKIISISEYTKREMLELYPMLDPENVKVSHLNHSLNMSLIKENTAISERYCNYLLFVGRRPHYKNFVKLVKALQYYLLDNPNQILICAGGGKFTNEERVLLRELKIEKQVIQHFFSNDSDLVTLYKNAKCFIFPSEYEGFGIPVLEAFQCGCIALLNNRTSLPEVGGNAALYFDIDNTQSLLIALNKLDDLTLISELKLKMVSQLLKFSWERFTDDHFKIYSDLCK